MACCDWDTFRDGFLNTWRRDRHNPSPLLIDWKKARRFWHRHHCTGGEAARTLLQDLKCEANFLWATTRKDAEDESGQPVAALPTAPFAAGLIARELFGRLKGR